MEDIVKEFNNTTIMCIDFLVSVTDDSDIKFYRKAVNTILMAEKNMGIEQYIIHCLPHEEHIINENKEFFINMQKDQVKCEEENLIHILKLREWVMTLDEDVISLLFNYFKLLCNFSKEYLKIKLKNVNLSI